MARKKKKNSKLSFGNLGLTKDEDDLLQVKLSLQDMSLAKLQRQLIRGWLSKEYKQTKNV